MQTLRFEATNDISPEQEFEIYCKKLDQGQTRYVIEEKALNPDGTLSVRIKKQYNAYKSTGYID